MSQKMPRDKVIDRFKVRLFAGATVNLPNEPFGRRRVLDLAATREDAGFTP